MSRARTFRLFPRRCVLFSAASLCIAGSLLAQESTPVESTWIAAGGTSNAGARYGDTLYIGGGFSVVGPSTGAGLTIDRTTGAPASEHAVVTGGSVEACIGDGAGGWYIGGDFEHVDGVPGNLVHLRADGSRDPGWNPVVNDEVLGLILDGTTLYVCGGFTTIDGQPRSGLCTFDTTTGLVSGWNPGIDWSVYAMELVGSTLYIGGDFGMAGGQTRNYLAAFDTNTQTLTSWNPDPDNYVYAIDEAGGTVYVGGEFETIGGQARTFMAALDPVTGLAGAWNPSADDYVENLLVAGGQVYIGGSFDVVGGLPRTELASVDALTGAVTAWAPNPDRSIYSLLATGSRLFVGGSFDKIAGADRAGLAVFDLATGQLDSYVSHSDGRVASLAAQGSEIYVGGDFATVGGEYRQRLAAIDLTTGLPTAWSLNADFTVRALAVKGDTLYIGGNFDEIGGQPREGLAAVDLLTGNLTAWDPGALGGEVLDLAVTDTTVFVSGAFHTVGGVLRNGLAAIDRTSGLATAWNPQPDVAFLSDLTLSQDESLIFVSGGFSSVGGVARSGLAALDTTTGLAAGWNPALDTSDFIWCTELSADGETLYIGGVFTIFDEQPRTNLAAVDTRTYAVSSFAPALDNSIYDMHAASGDRLFLYGAFTSLAGQPRQYLGALNTQTAQATEWAPVGNFPGSSKRLLVTYGSSVYTGVNLEMGTERPREGFSEFRTIDTTSFCDASDGALASCPCGNAGDPDSGCDIQQGTGGVRLTMAAQETSPANRVTLQGAGFPASTNPTAVVIRSSTLDPGAAVVFGDGLRCVGVPLVRLAATAASSGVSVHTMGHGTMAGSGDFYYQLWFRNTPAMFCTPDAFNLSNGRVVTW